MEFALLSSDQTAALARTIAALSETGDVILLTGELGAGKTFFARAFINAFLRGEHEVTSPTYTIMQCYEGTTGHVWHADLYRLDEGADIHQLGFDEALETGVVLVEWPERVDSKVWPKNHLTIQLKFADNDNEGERIAHLSASGEEWEEKLKKVQEKHVE